MLKIIVFSIVVIYMIYRIIQDEKKWDNILNSFKRTGEQIDRQHEELKKKYNK